MKARKILIFENSSQCYFGGGQKVTLQTIGILKKIYDEIIVYDYCDDSVFVQKVRELGIDVILLKKITLSFFIFNYLYNLLAFLFKARGGQTDFYISTKAGLLYVPFMRLCGRIFYHAHNIEIKGSVKARFMTMLIFVNKTICVSRSVKESLPTFIQKRDSTLVIYNYFDGFFKKHFPVYKYDKIIFLGSLNGIKGVDIAIKAFRRSRIIPNDCQFVICGEGDKKDVFMKLCQGDNRIIFKGFVEDIDSILSAGSALILPTVISEACPMSIIEAIFNSVPVITSNIGGQKELLDISNYGFSFEQGNVDSCMRAMEKLFDSNEISYISENNNIERFCELFSKENYVKSILNFFSESKCEEKVTGGE